MHGILAKKHTIPHINLKKRYNYMNKKHLLIFPLFLLIFTFPVLAQTSIIIFEQAEEVNLASSLGSKTYTLPAPGAKLRLDAKHTASGTTTDKNQLGNLIIEQKVNGTWTKIYEGCPGIVTEGDITLPIVGTVVGKKEASVAYETLVLDLDKHATDIRLSNSKLLVNAKQFCNLQVTMASFIEVAPHSLNMGEVVVGTGDTTATVHVTYCNVATTLLSSTNPAFRLTANNLAGAGLAQYNTEDVVLTFNPTIMGTHTTTLIATDNAGHTDSCNVQIRVTKRTPIFTWQLPETFAVGDTIAAPIASDCDNALALTTCDGGKLLISCGMLIAKAPGEVEVQALQLGDEEYWYNHLETSTLTITGEVPAPQVDTVVVRDTIISEIHDTTTIEIHDTIVNEIHDTTIVRDTIVVLDTLYIGGLTTDERLMLEKPMLHQDGYTIVAEQTDITALALYDAQGRLVRKEEGSEQIVMSLEALPYGYYVAVVVTPTKQQGVAIILHE